MESETVTSLRVAREYIRQGWAKGVFARNKDGDEVEATSYRATNWCMAGALKAACEHDDDVLDAAWVALGNITYGSIPTFNDNADTVSEVLEVYDRAIAAESGTA